MIILLVTLTKIFNGILFMNEILSFLKFEILSLRKFKNVNLVLHLIFGGNKSFGRYHNWLMIIKVNS